MEHATKIPVTVLTGFLGSGKTTLLNRLLHPEDCVSRDSVRIAIVINELGSVALDHRLVRHISDNVAILDSGCICCSVRGALVDTLQELFMAALQRKIAAFSRVLIETTGMADPAPVMYTLQYHAFLRERYRYDGCITVVDSVHAPRQLLQQPEAAQQLALADMVVLSKADLARPDQLELAARAVHAVNQEAPVYTSLALPALDELLRTASQGRRAGRRGSLRLFKDKAGAALAGKGETGELAHGSVLVMALRWDAEPSRSGFIQAMSGLQAGLGSRLLRAKGLLRFAGETQYSVVHGVHEQLYPIEALLEPQDDGSASLAAGLNACQASGEGAWRANAMPGAGSGFGPGAEGDPPQAGRIAFIVRGLTADEFRREAGLHFPSAIFLEKC